MTPPSARIDVEDDPVREVIELDDGDDDDGDVIDGFIRGEGFAEEAESSAYQHAAKRLGMD